MGRYDGGMALEKGTINGIITTSYISRLKYLLLHINQTRRHNTTQHNLLCQQHRALWSQFCNLYFKLFRCKMVKVLCLHTRLPQPSLEIAYSTCHKFKYYISNDDDDDLCHFNEKTNNLFNIWTHVRENGSNSIGNAYWKWIYENF